MSRTFIPSLGVITIISLMATLVSAQYQSQGPFLPNIVADQSGLVVSSFLKLSTHRPDSGYAGWVKRGPYADRAFHADSTSARVLFELAFYTTRERILFDSAFPAAPYDFEVVVPKGSEKLLLPLVRQTLQAAFRVTAESQTREIDVALLQKDPTKPLQLKSANPVLPSAFSSSTKGEYFTVVGTNANPEGLANLIQRNLGIVVLDETGSKDRGDFEIQWQRNNWPSLQESLAQVGLTLVKARRSVRVLAVRPLTQD